MSRLFMAVLLPPDVEADLDERVEVVRTAMPDLRWVPSSRWHITLEFLGECGPYEAERQRERWSERAGRMAPFEVSVAGAGAYPHAWMARVLWSGIAVEPASWQRIAGETQQPHLTVARTKQPRDLTGLVDSLDAYAGPSWLVDEVHLVESFLRSAGERGPRYQPVGSFALAGTQPRAV
jgi:RNA 2',3'-cyclic 3'-phosphodiesterase